MTNVKQANPYLSDSGITRRGFIGAAAIFAFAGQLHAESDVPPTGAARLIIAGFRGTSTADAEVVQVQRHLAEGSIAGVILLKRNVISPEQLLRLTHALREAAAPFLPIIAVDQEGGAVARLSPSNGFTAWPSSAEVASANLTEDELLDHYGQRVRELAFVGINLNLGPVLDLNVNPFNPIIGALGRSFGRDPESVVRHASAFVRAHRAAGVLTCAKHFPGHGSSITDSHLERTEINGTWSAAELLPFRMMVEQGTVDSLMTAHVIHHRFSDNGTYPVSMSRSGIEFARTDVGFDGPIMTDDMQMRSITRTYTEAKAAITAVQAGSTFLVYANHRPEHTIQAVERIGAHIRTGLASGQIAPRIWEERIATAARFQDRLRAI